MSAKHVLGIDIGGTKVRIALVNTSGVIIRTDQYSITKSIDIRTCLLEELDRFLAGEPPIGIGVGVKGLVAPDLRTVISSSVLQPALPWDICSELAARYGASCVIDNDVHAATCAEMLFGAGRAIKDFVYINVGTGLAAGMVVNGFLLRGGGNGAGEMGCCLCPRSEGEESHYELESVASGAGLASEARRIAPLFPKTRLKVNRHLTGYEVAQSAKSGDMLAQTVVQNAANAIALTVYNLMLLLDPEVFVFGGGVMQDGVMLLMIKKRYGELLRQAHRNKKPELILSSFGCDYTGVLGSASIWIADKGLNLKQGVNNCGDA